MNKVKLRAPPVMENITTARGTFWDGFTTITMTSLWLHINMTQTSICMHINVTMTSLWLYINMTMSSLCLHKCMAMTLSSSCVVLSEGGVVYRSWRRA